MSEHGSSGRRPRQAERGERWGRIPAGVLALLREGRLRHVDVAVLAAVGVLAGGRGYWSGPSAALAAAAAIHRHTAAAALDRLAAVGALTVTRPGRYTVAVTLREGHGVALDGREIDLDGHEIDLEVHRVTLDPTDTHPSRTTKTRDGHEIDLDGHEIDLDGHEIDLPNPYIREERRDKEKEPFSSLSGDTPDTPVSLDDLPPLSQVDTIPWAILREGLVPDDWLRDPTIRRTLNVLLNERVAADPSHPWYGCALVRSPHTLGGWRIIPDPTLQPRDIIPS